MNVWESLEEYEASFGDEEGAEASASAETSPPVSNGRLLAAVLLGVGSLILAPVAYFVIAFGACFGEACSGEELRFVMVPVFIVAGGVSAAVAVVRPKRNRQRTVRVPKSDSGE